MRHFRVLDQQTVQSFTSSRLGITTHADDGTDSERLHDDAQELVTFLVHGRHDLVRQFLRDHVAALLSVLEKEQWAVVVDEVIREEGLGLTEAFLKQSPETTTTHLGAMAGETGNLLTWVLFVRPTDRHLQAHPVADGGDLAEGHTSLRHAERAGIHA